MPRKARVGIYHYCCSARTRRHLAQGVLWLRETNYVDQGLEIDVGSPAKGKGCDLGYALAGNSRERVTRRGCMYRHSPWCDHCFRSSKPRLTSRTAVGFFGFGGSLSHLVEPITQPTLELTIFLEASPFDRRRNES